MCRPSALPARAAHAAARARRFRHARARRSRTTGAIGWSSNDSPPGEALSPSNAFVQETAANDPAKTRTTRGSPRPARTVSSGSPFCGAPLALEPRHLEPVARPAFNSRWHHHYEAPRPHGSGSRTWLPAVNIPSRELEPPDRMCTTTRRVHHGRGVECHWHWQVRGSPPDPATETWSSTAPTSLQGLDRVRQAAESKAGVPLSGCQTPAT